MARKNTGEKPKIVCVVCGSFITQERFFVVKRNRASSVIIGATCKSCLQMIPRNYRQTPNGKNTKDTKMVTVSMAGLKEDPHGGTWSFGDFVASYVLTERIVTAILPKAIESISTDRST